MLTLTGTWLIEVIQDGVSWYARARCVALGAGGPQKAMTDQPWLDLGSVNGADVAEAQTAAQVILESSLRVEVTPLGPAGLRLRSRDLTFSNADQVELAMRAWPAYLFVDDRERRLAAARLIAAAERFGLTIDREALGSC